ncbi:MAG: response regulator [Blastocatellales bacterium]
MGYKILLADDSVTVQKIITLTFSDEGADVLAVNNGDDAIHRLQYMRPALVMADVSIPGKNGYEICEFVKNHPEMKNTPVVLLVPAFEPFDEERARRIGADQHLTKPFQSIRTLITTVKNLIEAHPPQFTTGSFNNTGSLTPASEQPAQTVAETVSEEASPVIETPVNSAQVRETQPFPHDSQEDASPILPELPGQAPAEVAEMAVESVQESAEPAMVEIPESPLEFESDVIAEDLSEASLTESTAPESRLEVVAEEVAQAAEPEQPITVETFLVPESESATSAAGDLDQVLDLDDVLSWPPAPTFEPQAEVPQIVVPSAPSFTPDRTEMAIPQTVIDEIVERVVAQLSDRLTAKLASELAPEVAELVSKQMTPPPANQQADDSLLDLD